MFYEDSVISFVDNGQLRYTGIVWCDSKSGKLYLCFFLFTKNTSHEDVWSCRKMSYILQFSFPHACIFASLQVNVIRTLFYSGRQSRNPSLWVCRVWTRWGPLQGKTSRLFGSARPSQEPDQEFSLILYLTETKSIVSIFSGFMCVYHKSRQSEGMVALYAHLTLKALLWNT